MLPLKFTGGSPQGSLFGAGVTASSAVFALSALIGLAGASSSTSSFAIQALVGASGASTSIASSAPAEDLSASAVSASTASVAIQGSVGASGVSASTLTIPPEEEPGASGTSASAASVSLAGSVSLSSAAASSGTFDLGVIAPAPPLPPPSGGLLPGRPPYPPEELGKGMGPYKRLGQVFGEPDPISPRLSSRAPDPDIRLDENSVLLPFRFQPGPLSTGPVFHMEQVDEDTAVFALVALDELCGSDPVRGPITLHIVRRKV